MHWGAEPLHFLSAIWVWHESLFLSLQLFSSCQQLKMVKIKNNELSYLYSGTFNIKSFIILSSYILFCPLKAQLNYKSCNLL